VSAPALDPARLHVFVDFDGTISEPDTIRFLTECLGAGPEFYAENGRLLRAREISLRDSVSRCIASVRVPPAEALARVRQEVRVDPGFAPLARWCAARGVPLTIVSAGFEEIIEALVPRAEFPGVEVLANRFRPGTWECVFRDDTVFGHDKAAVVRAAHAAGRWTVFAGDGSSDREPAEVADEVFAKPGRPLAEHCRAQGIPFVAYDSLAEVLASLAARVAG
jgi:2,3-diketo-5-methylthio-1-phosphopentane phosphatase